MCSLKTDAEAAERTLTLVNNYYR